MKIVKAVVITLIEFLIIGLFILWFASLILAFDIVGPPTMLALLVIFFIIEVYKKLNKGVQ